MRLDALNIFIRVAELASFTRAAESLGLPKASISTAVQQLEAELGTQLLRRTTRRVEMSQDGRLFYERCKDLLADADEMQALFRQGPQSLRGRLRVDMPSAVARDYVIPRLPEFLDAHPELELELSSADRLVDVVREGFDCVLRVGTLSDSSLVARPLGSYRMINLASPAYLERHGLPRSLEDLSQHRMVHYASTLGSRPFGWEYRDAAGDYRTLPVPGALTVNGIQAYQAACLAGLGIIQAPAVGLRDALQRGLLVEVLPDFTAEPMPVSLIYAQRRNLSPRVRVFMEWLAGVMAPLLEPSDSATP